MYIGRSEGNPRSFNTLLSCTSGVAWRATRSSFCGSKGSTGDMISGYRATIGFTASILFPSRTEAKEQQGSQTTAYGSLTPPKGLMKLRLCSW